MWSGGLGSEAGCSRAPDGAAITQLSHHPKLQHAPVSNPKVLTAVSAPSASELPVPPVPAELASSASSHFIRQPSLELLPTCVQGARARATLPGERLSWLCSFAFRIFQRIYDYNKFVA